MRSARPLDQDLLVEYLSQLNAAHDDDRFTLDQMRARIEQLCANGTALIIEADDEAVGYAVIEDRGDFMFIRHFLIVDGRRGDGLGRAAYDAIADGPCAGRNIRLDASLTHPAPRAFWEAMGFKAYAYSMRLDRTGPLVEDAA